jgi:hypothetical protein
MGKEVNQPTPRPAAPPRADSDGQDELDAWVKAVVDRLPPLTEAQRDLLALIFRARPRKTKRK